MNVYSGFEYLLIDCANHFGLDKMLFEDRIQWGRENLDQLESLTGKAESAYLFMKSVAAIRKAQLKVPTGHLVALDACCSGMQIMSAITGCLSGARATGLVDPNRRADAYTELTQRMQVILGSNIHVTRKDAKAALMTSYYGSKEQPKIIFGEDTQELAAFYQACMEMAPGAYELLQELLDTWQPYALVHAWKLPDGFDARVKVMQREETRIEVDELGHASFTYEYYVNQGSKKGLSNVANTVHSIDGFILREMVRRCNHKGLNVRQLHDWVHAVFYERAIDNSPIKEAKSDEVKYFIEQYERSQQPTAAILPWLNLREIEALPQGLLADLKRILTQMTTYTAFPVVTIHDSFSSHANNCNWVRHWYKEILAELADSEILSDIMSQLHQSPGKYEKLSSDLSKYIRQSNYSLS